MGKNQRSTVKKKWQKLKGPQSEINSKKSKVHGRRKLAKNLISAVRENWQKSKVHSQRKMVKDQRSAVKEQWQEIIGLWSEKNEKISKVHPQSKKMVKNQWFVVKEKWQKINGPR